MTLCSAQRAAVCNLSHLAHTKPCHLALVLALLMWLYDGNNLYRFSLFALPFYCTPRRARGALLRVQGCGLAEREELFSGSKGAGPRSHGGIDEDAQVRVSKLCCCSIGTGFKQVLSKGSKGAAHLSFHTCALTPHAGALCHT
eukprot:1157763-Pelagomonas_calceolata.AAC.5